MERSRGRVVVAVLVAKSSPALLWPIRLLCPRNSPGKNTGVSCHFLLWGIFLTQGLNLCLLHCRQILYHWATRKSSPGLLHESKSQMAACTMNIKLGILIVPPPSYKSLTPLRPMLSGYTALSPVPILSRLLFHIQDRPQTLDGSLFSISQVILDVLTL